MWWVVVSTNTHPETLISLGYITTVTHALGDNVGTGKIETKEFQGWTTFYGCSPSLGLESVAGLAWVYASTLKPRNSCQIL